MEISLKINGATTPVKVDEDTPLLWVLRDYLDLTGTKYSCGIGVCGSCMILIDDEPVQACQIKVSEAVGKQITTIEGLVTVDPHPLVSAWLEKQVPQCGYCQSGQIVMAYALLSKNHNPSDEEIDEAMSQVLCRCGTYPRIRQALQQAAQMMREQDKSQ
jgi:aerobic-type carbon monoxide dehydrogenase small subunit (CoxS/CutS family)